MCLVRQGARKICPGLQQIDHDQSEQQRHERGADEPAHRLCENAAQLRAASHVGYAVDQCCEHQRSDDHLDQAQEQHRDQVYVRGDICPDVWKIVENQGSHHNAKRHCDQDVLCKPVGHRYPLGHVKPEFATFRQRRNMHRVLADNARSCLGAFSLESGKLDKVERGYLKIIRPDQAAATGTNIAATGTNIYDSGLDCSGGRSDEDQIT